MIASGVEFSISEGDIASFHENFAVRGHLLSHLTRGKSQEYIRELLENEAAVKDAFLQFVQESSNSINAPGQISGAALNVKESVAGAIESVNEEHSQQQVVSEESTLFVATSLSSKVNDSGVVTSESNIDASNTTKKESTGKMKCSEKFRCNSWHCPLWTREAISGLAVMVLYCIAHLSLYEFIYAIVTEATKNIVCQDMLYAILFSASLLLTFSTGGAFAWNPEEQQCDIDAKSLPWIMRWFMERPLIKSIVDLFCLYFCFIAVTYFHHKCLGTFDARQDLLNALPSTKHGSVTLVGYIMSLGDSRAANNLFFNNLPAGSICPSTENEFCWANRNSTYPHISRQQSVTTDMLEKDTVYLSSQLSALSYYLLMGTFEGPLYTPRTTFFYYGICTSLSFYLLWRLGYHFWAR